MTPKDTKINKFKHVQPIIKTERLGDQKYLNLIKVGKRKVCKQYLQRSGLEII